MININVPNAPYSFSEMTLGGKQYTFIFRYNNRDERWRMDIYNLSDPVILGVKIMESKDLLGSYDLENFTHGNLYCLRNKQDNKLCTRDNLGIGFPYQIIYFNNTELEAI